MAQATPTIGPPYPIDSKISVSKIWIPAPHLLIRCKCIQEPWENGGCHIVIQIHTVSMSVFQELSRLSMVNLCMFTVRRYQQSCWHQQFMIRYIKICYSVNEGNMVFERSRYPSMSCSHKKMATASGHCTFDSYRHLCSCKGMNVHTSTPKS